MNWYPYQTGEKNIFIRFSVLFSSTFNAHRQKCSFLGPQFSNQMFLKTVTKKHKIMIRTFSMLPSSYASIPNFLLPRKYVSLLLNCYGGKTKIYILLFFL